MVEGVAAGRGSNRMHQDTLMSFPRPRRGQRWVGMHGPVSRSYPRRGSMSVAVDYGTGVMDGVPSTPAGWVMYALMTARSAAGGEGGAKKIRV